MLVGNLLLDQLDDSDRQILTRHLANIDVGATLLSNDEPGLVYFPIEGLISIMTGEGERSLDQAFVGREGWVGPVSMQGRRNGAGARVRVAGRAFVVPVGTFRRAVAACPPLRDILYQHGLTCLDQAGQAIFAASRCTVEQRLARWLLMAHNRLDCDEIDITHDVLAGALGVRRPGITVGLHILEGHHAIRARRSLITILSRDGLKASAGFAYNDMFYEQPLRASPNGQDASGWPRLKAGESAAYP